MPSDVGVLVAAAVCWAGFAYKLRHLRYRAAEAGGAALRALVVVLGLSASLATLSSQLVARRLDSLIGVSGVTRFAANLVSMCTCLAIIGWLLYLSRPGVEARSRLLVHLRVLGVVVALSAVLFVYDHPPVSPAREFAGVHTYLFLLYVTYGVSAQVGLSWRYASAVDAPMLRLGLRTVSVSNLLGLGCGAIALLYLLDRDLNLQLPGSTEAFAPLYALASVLFVVGMTLPAWGPRVGLEAVWWRMTRRRAAKGLRQLWNVVTDAYPGVVLERELLAASPYGERLVAERLPVEIHDGWLQLRYYVAREDAKLAHSLAVRRNVKSDDRAALVAAALLMVAVQRRKRSSGSPPTATPPMENLGTGANTTLVADVRFLCDVSKNLRSRFVRDVLAEIDTGPGSVLARQGARPG